MNHLEQLVSATLAVYIISNTDGSDCEFLQLRPVMASDMELQSLRARWAGRNLNRSGVAALIAGIPRVVLKEEPSDFMTIVRLTAAFTQYVAEMAAEDSLRADTSVMWCEQLYALQDPRT